VIDKIALRQREAEIDRGFGHQCRTEKAERPGVQEWPQKPAHRAEVADSELGRLFLIRTSHGRGLSGSGVTRVERFCFCAPIMWMGTSGLEKKQ